MKKKEKKRIFWFDGKENKRKIKWGKRKERRRGKRSFSFLFLFSSYLLFSFLLFIFIYFYFFFSLSFSCLFLLLIRCISFFHWFQHHCLSQSRDHFSKRDADWKIFLCMFTSFPCCSCILLDIHYFSVKTCFIILIFWWRFIKTETL